MYYIVKINPCDGIWVSLCGQLTWYALSLPATCKVPVGTPLVSLNCVMADQWLTAINKLITD